MLTKSRSLIDQAEKSLREGDSLQACEKAEEAALLAVKTIAKRQGWEYEAKEAQYNAVLKIARWRGDRDIVMLFNTANILLHNFREGWLDDEYIAADIQSIDSLIDTLERV